VDRMLVVVFDNEAKAIEGRNALLQLDNQGTILVYAWAVIVKNADQTSTVKQSDNPGPRGTLIGTSLGALIGLLGGSAGLAIGSAVAGNIVDLNKAIVRADFIDDVTKELLPNRSALLAEVKEVKEDSTTPVDTRMEPFGGIVFRRALSDVKHPTDMDHVAAIKADLARMKAELNRTRAARRAKLQEKINQLDSKIQEQLLNTYVRREEEELGEQAKAEALEVKTHGSKALAGTTSTKAGTENKRDGT
jgi:uncharacterized membrane protein